MIPVYIKFVIITCFYWSYVKTDRFQYQGLSTFRPMKHSGREEERSWEQGWETVIKVIIWLRVKRNEMTNDHHKVD